jgi:hypothetical protein
MRLAPFALTIFQFSFRSIKEQQPPAPAPAQPQHLLECFQFVESQAFSARSGSFFSSSIAVIQFSAVLSVVQHVTE